MTRFLVTGGAGAIGSNLVDYLFHEGHDVTILDDLSSGHRTLIPSGAEFINGGVHDEEYLQEAFETQPDQVVHMAALFANQNSVDHPERDLLINGMGTLRLFEHAQAQGVDKVLYVSSSCVYGAKEVMIETDQEYHPDTPYAITKLLGERYASFFANHHGLNVVTMRPFNNYGPGEFPGPYRNVIPNFMARAMSDEPLIITGDGTETRDFTYVGDTVRCMVNALQAPTEPGDIFNIASGRETAIGDLARMINEVTGNDVPIEFAPRRSWDIVRYRKGNIDKARRLLDYRPETDLRTGLQATYNWLRSHV